MFVTFESQTDNRGAECQPFFENDCPKPVTFDALVFAEYLFWHPARIFIS